MSQGLGSRHVGAGRGEAATPIAPQPLTPEQRADRTLRGNARTARRPAGCTTLEIPVRVSRCGDRP
jgi:hypothetical protein